VPTANRRPARGALTANHWRTLVGPWRACGIPFESLPAATIQPLNYGDCENTAAVVPQETRTTAEFAPKTFRNGISFRRIDRRVAMPSAVGSRGRHNADPQRHLPRPSMSMAGLWGDRRPGVR